MEPTVPRFLSLSIRAFAGAALLLVAAAPVSADCAGPPDLPNAWVEVQGTTFVGTVQAFEVISARAGAEVTWTIGRVYSGGPLPEDLTFTTDPCYAAYVLPGAEYLFSTSDIAEPQTGNSVAWTIGADGGIKHWGWASEKPSNFPSGIRDIESFADALEAVAPGAGEGLPPTDAIDAMFDSAPGSNGSGLWLGALFASVLTWVAIRGVRRRVA